MSSNALKTPLNASLSRFAEQKTQDRAQQFGKDLPCRVVEVISSGIVVVSFEVTSKVWTLPNIMMPVFGSEYIRLPIQVGDLGRTVAADGRLGGVSGLGNGPADIDHGAANLATLMFAWCGSKNWSETDDPNAVVIYGPNGAILRDQAKTNTVTVNSNGTNIHCSRFGAFGTDPAEKQTISGPLSSVSDASAKAVMTSIIDALTAYGWTTNGTT